MSLPDGMDWLMRPVLAGKVDMVELHRTNLSLLDFAILNDAMDIQIENERRIRAAQDGG